MGCELEMHLAIAEICRSGDLKSMELVLSRVKAGRKRTRQNCLTGKASDSVVFA